MASGVVPVQATAYDRAMSPNSFDLEDLGMPPAGHETLVDASDPEYGPYKRFLHVPEAEVDAHCRAGYRRLTLDEVTGPIEDYTEGWKHSD